MIDNQFLLKTVLAVAVACGSGSLLRANQELATTKQHLADERLIDDASKYELEQKMAWHSLLTQLGVKNTNMSLEQALYYFECHPDKCLKRMIRIFGDKQSIDALIELIDINRQCALLIAVLFPKNFELLNNCLEFAYYFVASIASTKKHNTLLMQEIVLKLGDYMVDIVPSSADNSFLHYFYLSHETYGPIYAKKVLDRIRRLSHITRRSRYTNIFFPLVITAQPHACFDYLIVEDQCNLLSEIVLVVDPSYLKRANAGMNMIAQYARNNLEIMLKQPHGMRVALYFLRYYEFDDLDKLLPHIKSSIGKILQEIDCDCAHLLYESLLQAGKKHDEIKKLSLSFLNKCMKHFFKFRFPFKELCNGCSPTLKHVLATGLAALRLGNNDGSVLPVLQLGHMVIKKEQDLNSQGYCTFLHGQRWRYQLVEEWHTKLWSVVHSQNTQDFLFAHVKQVADGQDEQASKRNLITLSGRNAILPDNSDPRQLMLFMNAGFFYNSNNMGSNTAYYILNNCNVNTHIQLTLQDVFKLHNIESIYNTYHNEIEQLEDEHAKLSDCGNLLLIAVPENIVDQAVFIAAPGGYKKKVSITDSGQTDDIKLILNTLRTNPEKIEEFDDIEFCLVMTADKQGGLNPESGIKFFQFNTVDPERWKQFKEREQALFERISQAIQAQVVQTEHSPQSA